MATLSENSPRHEMSMAQRLAQKRLERSNSRSSTPRTDLTAEIEQLNSERRARNSSLSADPNKKGPPALALNLSATGPNSAAAGDVATLALNSAREAIDSGIEQQRR